MLDLCSICYVSKNKVTTLYNIYAVICAQELTMSGSNCGRFKCAHYLNIISDGVYALRVLKLNTRDTTAINYNRFNAVI